MSEELGFRVDYSKLTKEQLKQLCEQNGLKKSGNKEDLLERLNQLADSPAPEVAKRTRVTCPSCSKALMYPTGYTEELKCPECSNVFDPRVSTFVAKHGAQIKLQGTGNREQFLFSILILYLTLLALGFSGLGLPLGEDCFLFLLCLFNFLPFIGLIVSIGEGEGSWKHSMVVIFGILSAIHALLFIGLLLLIGSWNY